MQLIRPSFEILEPNGYKLKDIKRFITLVAYTCYKTEKTITNDSASTFVDGLIKSGHTAMLEHGTVYLKIPCGFVHRFFHPGLISKYQENKYSKVTFGGEFIDLLQEHNQVLPYVYITTNLRVIQENNWWGDVEKYSCEPTSLHEIRRTVKFITDRGVSHELVRHRTFSFAQESTRYCNYSKDKFGNEVTFIEPVWYDQAHISIKNDFNNFLIDSEKAYFNLLNNQYTPQQARQVLPNALKTEIVLTAFESDWVHFFNLRALGLTGAPHPDMLNLAEPLFSQFLEKFPSFAHIFNEVHKNLK